MTKKSQRNRLDESYQDESLCANKNPIYLGNQCPEGQADLMSNVLWVTSYDQSEVGID